MGVWNSSRRRGAQGFTLSELLLVVVFVVGLLVVAYSAASGIRDQTATSDCQTQLRSLKMAAAEYQARRGAFPPDKETLVVEELVSSSEVDRWELTYANGDTTPTYRAADASCR
ncbi:MAG: hypothetical protein KF703_13865 [Actinobacteria bacterium]|nr:hypothetical protein [Actinomycetota bacterium]